MKREENEREGKHKRRAYYTRAALTLASTFVHPATFLPSASPAALIPATPATAADSYEIFCAALKFFFCVQNLAEDRLL